MNLEIKAEVEAGGWECFMEGGRFVASVEGSPICWAGEIKPEVLEFWELEMPVAALEFDIDMLFKLDNK